MSKRYGRQQKRKARLEIERLERIISRQKDVDSVVESARRIVEAVKKVCPNSVFLDKARVDRGFYRDGQFGVSPYVFCKNGELGQPIDIRFIDLYDLSLSMSEPPFLDMVHFDLEFSSPYKEKTVYCYRISKEGLNHQSTLDIATQLVDALKQEIKNTQPKQRK